MARSTDKRWKGILIDWEEISDMDSEDYELKPLNQQQTAILLALLEYQKWPTRWVNLGISKDELETYIADIEQRLMRNEDGQMVTKQELIEGICEGMVCYTGEIAKKIISGVTGGIVIDEDGNVTVGGGGDADGIELPPDNPATPDIDESLAARAGGCQNIRIVINQLLGDMAAWHFAAATQEQARQRLTLIYGIEAGAALDYFVNFYYVTDATPDTVITCTASLDSAFFCRGVNSESFSYYSLKIHTPTTDRETLLALAPCLTQEVLNKWYEQGIDTPSSLYLDYSCVLQKPETVTITSMNTNFQTQTSWKPNHRLKISTSGLFTDTNGHKRDFWYYDANNAAPSFIPASTSIQLGTGITKPTINQVPFSASGTYIFTLDTPAASGAAIFNLAAGGVMGAPITGSITVLIEDLGEIGI